MSDLNEDLKQAEAENSPSVVAAIKAALEKQSTETPAEPESEQA